MAYYQTQDEQIIMPVQTEYFENGALKKSKTFNKDGVLEGPFEYRYDNGVIESKGTTHISGNCIGRCEENSRDQSRHLVQTFNAEGHIISGKEYHADILMKEWLDEKTIVEYFDNNDIMHVFCNNTDLTDLLIDVQNEKIAKSEQVNEVLKRAGLI